MERKEEETAPACMSRWNTSDVIHYSPGSPKNRIKSQIDRVDLFLKIGKGAAVALSNLMCCSY